METSLRDFKGRFTEALVSLLWKQWEKLGLAAWTSEEVAWKWPVDLEALVFATTLVKEEDQRLYHGMQVWLAHYRRLLHTARLKRIWRRYREYAAQMNLPVPEHEEVPGASFRVEPERVRKILGPPHWEDPSLVWLKLRALLGAGVRSDAAVYFLYHNLGTTFSIAREMFVDQKSVHEALRLWEWGGWVRRFGQRRGYTVSPGLRACLQEPLGLRDLPPYMNTARVMLGMLLVKGLVQRFLEQPDEYLLSSYLREVTPLLREAWEGAGVPLPDPLAHPGKAYAPVFLHALLELFRRLGRTAGPQQTEAGFHRVTRKGGTGVSFTERDMYEAAYRVLRRRYPAHEGWKIVPQFEGVGYRPDFVVERRDFWGTLHRVIAEVKAECRITRAHLRQLNAYARALAGGEAVIDAKILIVPAGADTTAVPNDIQVIYLRGFRCGDNRWEV